jgi:HK97 family phage portal protein
MALWTKRTPLNPPRDGEIPARPLTLGNSSAYVSADTALRVSAVWACLRLRANLISTMPLDAYRRVGDVQVEVVKPSVLVNPDGRTIAGVEVEGMKDWLHATQFDLDRCGNCFGIVTARSGNGLPARIELVPFAEVSVIVKAGRLDGYRIAGTVYRPDDIWHERQYPVAGFPLGLSPVAYAAWKISEYLSIQQFAADWFGSGGVPKAMLRNTRKPTIEATNAREIKDRFRAAVAGDGLWITGSDWEYEMVQADQAGSQWLDAQQSTATDIARFFDCPADLIDAAVSGQSVTYANITQRNLQFLIMSLEPAIVRRETALSALLARPRYVKFNTNALLRMDPKTQAELFSVLIDARVRPPSEVRELLDLPPLTSEQAAEFDRLFGAPRTTPVPAAVA